MVLLAVAVVSGLTAGLLRPRLGARSLRPHVRRVPLLVAGAAGTAAAQLLADDLATVAMGVALTVLLAFVASNAHLTGVLVIGVGLLVNLIAVVVNNGMPVRGDSLVAAGVIERAGLDTAILTGPRHLESSRDRLGVLGDVLPVPATREVLSFGDLIVLLGAADAVRELARRHRQPWSARERRAYVSTMTQLRAVHDWGAAPSGAPVSGSQYSEKPERRAPSTIDLTRPAHRRSARPLAASHSR